MTKIWSLQTVVRSAREERWLSVMFVKAYKRIQRCTKAFCYGFFDNTFDLFMTGLGHPNWLMEKSLRKPVNKWKRNKLCRKGFIVSRRPSTGNYLIREEIEQIKSRWTPHLFAKPEDSCWRDKAGILGSVKNLSRGAVGNIRFVLESRQRAKSRTGNGGCWHWVQIIWIEVRPKNGVVTRIVSALEKL